MSISVSFQNGSCPGRLDVSYGVGAYEGWPRAIPAEERIARERRLRRAVLIEAIRCLEGTSESRERAALRRQALNWLHGYQTSSPFSFLNVCESLGLDACSVRREVLARFAGPAARGVAGNQLADIVRERKRRGRVTLPRGVRSRMANLPAGRRARLANPDGQHAARG
jgi:hypothetical protein